MPSTLQPGFTRTILAATGASSIEECDLIQSLWSGYGKLLRLHLKEGPVDSVIAKLIRMQAPDHHPRGWNSNLSHQRKLKSYQVESQWYRDWSRRCGPSFRLPAFLAFEETNGEILLVLEDLDAAGYPVRPAKASREHINSCLDWLARFHANFMGARPDGLWKTGTYWHLETRSEELDALEDHKLRKAAPMLDQILNNARYQTLVHGDAKLANFCFSSSGTKVAAVDFQYVGGGCGIKDVAYFIGSCLDESSCEKQERELLGRYFRTFRLALETHHPQINPDLVEAEWRSLYPVAWTDFHRFLKGWSPGHWKINSYSERLAREVLATL